MTQTHANVPVSVEDAYKCKRSLSVPGIAVNVRRILVRSACTIRCLNFVLMNVSL